MLDFKNQRLLVIAPHPDDEVIGCGGLIQKVKDAGGHVFVLFLTVGTTRDFTKKGLSTGSERKKEIEAVSRFLKFDNYDLVFYGDRYHLRLDTLGQKALMEVIERKSKVSIEKIKPSMVAFPSTVSYNQDHRIVACAAHASLRPAASKNKHFVSCALAYEEPADEWTLKHIDTPDFFIKLERENVEKKIEAVKLYKSQSRDWPNLRSPEAIRQYAALRGALCGCDFAEGFVLKRLLI